MNHHQPFPAHSIKKLFPSILYLSFSDVSALFPDSGKFSYFISPPSFLPALTSLRIFRLQLFFTLRVTVFNLARLSLVSIVTKNYFFDLRLFFRLASYLSM